MIEGLRVQSYRRGRRWAPELRLTAGPAGEGVTGDGSYAALWGHAWATALDRDRGFVMLRAIADIWTEVAALTPLPTVDPKQVHHHASAFDGSGRPTLAWEQAGMVYLRQWDPITSQVVTRGPFPGCDPVLINDASVHGAPPFSDVVLFHLDAGRSQLIGRVEHELYATPHVQTSVPAGSQLDQVAADALRLLWFGCDAQEQPWALASAPYPFQGHDTLTVSATLTGSGILQPVVLNLQGTDELEVAALLTGAGIYQPVILTMEEQPADELVVTAALTGSGLLQPVVYAFAGADDLVVTNSLTGAGAYPLSVITHSQSPDGLEVAMSLTGVGSYVSA